MTQQRRVLRIESYDLLAVCLSVNTESERRYDFWPCGTSVNTRQLRWRQV